MVTPTELARQAQTDILLLRQEFRTFVDGYKSLDVRTMSERLAVLEDRVARLEKAVEEVKHMPAILDRLNKLEEEKRESHKRSANFIYAVIGIAIGIVGNLIVSAFKKS